MDEQIHLKAEAGVSEITLRTGEALKPREQRTFNTTGEIKTPGDFLEFRKPDPSRAIIHINRADKSIQLILNENDQLTSSITGKMKTAPELLRFEINTGKKFNLFQLRDLIKANRRFFSTSDYEGLLKQLTDLKVGAEVKLQKSNDNRGNLVDNFEMKLKTQLASVIMLTIPVYVGFEMMSFNVELCFDLVNTEIIFWFISNDLQEIQDTFPQQILEKEIARFTGAAETTDDLPFPPKVDNGLSNYLVLYVTG